MSSAPSRTPTAWAPPSQSSARCARRRSRSSISPLPAEPGFLERLPHGRDTLVVAGCEAHVCALQTVDGLIDAGYQVKWVSDAVGSRRFESRNAATARARAMGADVVTTEMVLFEWLMTSKHPSFRKISKLIR